jgi:hypothetical protein
LSRARYKLQGYQDDNRHEVDFDELKAKRAARGMTFSRWAAECKGKANEDHIKRLEKSFGDKLLTTIDDKAVENYSEQRGKEKIIRHGKESKKIVSQTTVNKELSTLRKLLRMARRKGIDGKPIRVSLFEYWFRASCKCAGVKDFRFHDLRHCAISRWGSGQRPDGSGDARQRSQIGCESQEISEPTKSRTQKRLPKSVPILSR